MEVGADTLEVEAKVADAEARERLWTQQRQDLPGFAEYERKTERQIPVVILEPAA